MTNINWLLHLQGLIARVSHLHIGADIGSLGLIELWALYRHFLRLLEA
jgi:hypothetical protein